MVIHAIIKTQHTIKQNQLTGN